MHTHTSGGRVDLGFRLPDTSSTASATAPRAKGECLEDTFSCPICLRGIRGDFRACAGSTENNKESEVYGAMKGYKIASHTKWKKSKAKSTDGGLTSWQR